MSWLLIAGGVVAIGLAAWAFFAPARPESGEPVTPRDGSEPGR